MESNNRHVIGRSIVLERQERFSFQTNERIYLKKLYQNPSFDVARISSSSDDIEKIHRTRERVASLNSQINYEIERLKDLNNSLSNKKDERFMTWDERFRANPPLINVLKKQHGPGRKDEVSKPGFKEVKQKDGVPPKRGPSPKELPNELRSNGLPTKGPSPKELPKELNPKLTPPMRLPPKDLTYILLPKKEIPPNRLPLEELNPRELPPRALPAKEIPPKGLPLKEHNPRKPTTGVLPPKELPPKGHPLKTNPPKGVTSKTMPLKGALPKTIPSKDVVSKTFPSKGVPPKATPPKSVPPKTILPKWVPLKATPSKGVPLKATPSKGVPPKTIPSKGILQKNIPSKGVLPKNIRPKAVPAKTIPSKGVLPKTISSKGVPPKTIPSKAVLPKAISSKGVLPKNIPPKAVPPKTINSKGVPPKTIPSKGVLPKTIPPKEVPPKGVTLRNPPPKVCPRKDLPPKDLPAKRLPLQELPSKKTPPKAPMTRKEPPKICTQKELKPGKPPTEDVTPKKPIPKEEPIKRSLGDGTPDKHDARIRGGCCHCYCNYDQCCCPTLEGACYISTDCHCDMGFNRGIKYGIQYCTARRRTTDLNTEEICSNRCVGVSPDRKSSKQCNSVRESTRDKNRSPIRSGRTSSPANKMSNQEKFPKVESQEKVQKVSNPGKRPEKIMMEKPPLKKDYQPSGNIKRENPRAPKRDITKLGVLSIAPPTKEQNISVDERMYEDYLSLYYQENSKSDLLETPRPTPTYTRLQESDATRGHSNSKEGQRGSMHRDSQGVKHQVSGCFAEMYPGPFRYEECFEEQDYRTEPVNQLPQPIRSRANSQHQKSTRSQNKNRQGVRPESVMAREVPKNVLGERSSWETESTSYASLPVKRQSGYTTRQASTSTETQRSKERSSPTYPLHRSEKSTQVYNNRQSNLSSRPPSSRKDYSPTTDSPSNLSPISFREGSYRKAQSSQTRDSGRQSNSRPTSSREEPSEMPQSSTTIPFEANSSSIALSQTTDTCDTTVINPSYQTEDSQCLCKHSSNESWDETSECDPKFVRFMVQDSEMGEEEDDIQSICECNGYETARSIDSNKHSNLRMGSSYSPDRSGDESLPIAENLSEKRIRTVTFKDEDEYRSLSNWEQAQSNRQRHSTFSNDNYTSRSSSSAEHTCLESSCDDEDAYDSCFESPHGRDEQMPSFKACPCMYETYRQLAALCQTKSPYYR